MSSIKSILFKCSLISSKVKIFLFVSLTFNYIITHKYILLAKNVSIIDKTKLPLTLLFLPLRLPPCILEVTIVISFISILPEIFLCI